MVNPFIKARRKKQIDDLNKKALSGNGLYAGLMIFAVLLGLWVIWGVYDVLAKFIWHLITRIL